MTHFNSKYEKEEGEGDVFDSSSYEKDNRFLIIFGDVWNIVIKGIRDN